MSNSSTFPADVNPGEDASGLKDKYTSLKKKYISLLKDHSKVIKEYEKCNQELVDVNSEKKYKNVLDLALMNSRFLRNKIEDLLKSKGLTIQDIIKDDQA